MEYTVGEMAKRLGVKPSALRYYDKEGLIPSVKRSAAGTRIFTSSDYELLKIIECLKKTGMHLCDIKQFVSMLKEGDASIDGRLRLMQKQRRAVLEKLGELKETLEVLEYKCWYYESAKKAGSTSAVDSLGPDELPKRFLRAVRRLKSE